MANVLHFILLTIFLPVLTEAQQTNGFVPVGASLTATDHVNRWLSPSGDFAFGFQRTGQDNFMLSIWYDKINDKTIIWYPEGGPTVPRGSKVELTDGRGLVLTDPQGTDVWNSTSALDIAYAVMNDSGNFMIFGSDSSKIWESFNFPTDTMLPTQIMERGGVLNSGMSNTDFSNGRFQLRLLRDGNLVLNTRDVFSGKTLDAYYISGTRDATNASNSGFQLIFDVTGYMSILRQNGERSDLTTSGKLPSGDYYHRATLDSDGVFTQYYLSKNPTGNTTWEYIWYVPENICNKIGGTIGSAVCGLNKVCSLDGYRPNCECPRGFSLLDSDDPKSDCIPDYTPTCDGNYRGDLFDFIELAKIDWPELDYARINPSDEQSCKNSCLDDCFCAVAIFRDNQCWKKALPLVNGKEDPSFNVKAFVKFRKGDGPLQSPPRFSGENKNRRSLIFVGPVLLSTYVFVIVLLFSVICVGFFLTYKKKAKNKYSTNLSQFTYEELVKATNSLQEELGKGAFGIVYKGVIGTNIMAVKKLDRVFQDGEKEFQTEVNAIATTHHKNLVQLLGYCDEGEQRLLAYEYMCNGTLASFLFGDERPSWKQRSHIALGVAKGLSYLHEDCSTQIIHCDIKPQKYFLMSTTMLRFLTLDWQSY